MKDFEVIGFEMKFWNDRHFPLLFRAANSRCVRHHIPVLNTVAVLRLMQHEIAHEQKQILFLAVWCFAMLIIISDLLYKYVILCSITNRNHMMCNDVILYSSAIYILHFHVNASGSVVLFCQDIEVMYLIFLLHKFRITANSNLQSESLYKP